MICLELIQLLSRSDVSRTDAASQTGSIKLSLQYKSQLEFQTSCTLAHVVHLMGKSDQDDMQHLFESFVDDWVDYYVCQKLIPTIMSLEHKVQDDAMICHKSTREDEIMLRRDEEDDEEENELHPLTRPELLHSIEILLGLFPHKRVSIQTQLNRYASEV